MQFKKQKLSLLVGLLAFSLQGFSAPVIVCPPVNLVSEAWQRLDDAIPDSRSYIVVSSHPAFSSGDKDWVIRTIVPAHNQEDAIKLAQITVHQASSLMTANAVSVFDQYGCIYFSARAFVYALTK